jgi:hypothetical protein
MKQPEPSYITGSMDNRPTDSIEVSGTARDGTPVTAPPLMSLRDHFAAMALHGLLAGPELEDTSPRHLARLAYERADAMMDERER